MPPATAWAARGSLRGPVGPPGPGAVIARPGDNLNAMIAALLPGDTLEIQGTHSVAALVAVNGTATKPITIRGNGAVIRHPDGVPSSGGSTYAVEVTGDYLHFIDVVAQEAGKAWVLTNANHVRFDRCVGRTTSTEVWKFREGSNYIYLADCLAEGAGQAGTFGEGFYVGNASTNWVNNNPDGTSYVQFERCRAVRCNGDGFDIKEGAHHVIVADCTVDFTKGNAPAAGATYGDSGVYSRGDSVQIINLYALGVPGSGHKLYDVVVNSVTYGRNQQVWGGLVDGAGGAGVSSQSDDLRIYSNFRADATGGRIEVVGGGWGGNANLDPATFVRMAWSSPAADYGIGLSGHGASHGPDGPDPIVLPALGPADVGAAPAVHTHLGTDLTTAVPVNRLPGAGPAAYGILQLAGDLGGTSAAPTVPGLANKVNTSALGANNGVATLGSDGKLTPAQAPAGGGSAGLPAAELNDFLCWTCDPLNAGTTPAMTAGVIYLARVVVDVARTLNGAWFYNTASGAMNSLGYVGLYDASGTRRAQTANITTAWQSLGDKQCPFMSPYAAPAGDYWVAFLANGTTLPKPSCAPGARANLGLTGARLRSASILTGQTALPASLTMANMAAYGTLMSFGVY